MKEVSKYIVENWQWLLVAFFSLVSVLTSFFKKKPKAWDPYSYASDVVALFAPKFIIEAERTGLSGSEKLEYVVDKLMRVLNKEIVVDRNNDSLRHFFISCIESILDTPRKHLKGGK